MNLGVQYYRAPFPDQKYWKDDFAKIKDSGFNTVQLWVLWAWVEARPDKFNFNDYDQLVELADKNGLGVVLSTIAEIQPHWIHRIVPDSEMIDHRGNKVISSNRCECHFGITPGGCTDHPGVWERMEIFLRETASRYHNFSHLKGWDAWNELRWNVHADGIVCFCPHTLQKFRGWLDEKYGGLDGLNQTWKRRYTAWEDVMPGKLPDRPYTEMMAFEHFITCRADQHALDRYNVIKSIDKTHPVTVHGGAPTPLCCGSQEVYPVDRGNDWNFAASLDGIGCSSFPKWNGIDDADFGMRIEFVKSAAGNKKVWLSEIQGGRAAIGFNIYDNVDAKAQQRWIWNGLACGADTFLFWCWRDEVFGRESAGFGIAGNDGLAEERLSAMKITGKLLKENDDVFSSYQPDEAEVGIFFSPQSYYLHWAQESSAQRVSEAIRGYARALVRKSIPYRFIEAEHLEDLSRFRILFFPRSIVLDKDQEKKIEEYLKNGGILFCESEFGAFDCRGFYRYPEERFTARICGARELGRRNLNHETLPVKFAGGEYELELEQWLTPLAGKGGQVLAETESGPLIAEYECGKGKVIYCGTYLGNRYYKNRKPDFEDFVEQLVKASRVSQKIKIISPSPAKDSFLYLKTGKYRGGNIAFVFFPETSQEAVLSFSKTIFPGEKVIDLLSGNEFTIAASGDKRLCTVKASYFNIAILK
ncbi:MAG: beta-galactosidase [Victivallaceae bacterium]|nr:beta-galactosidase [Victivallaceae bacterium]